MAGGRIPDGGGRPPAPPKSAPAYNGELIFSSFFGRKKSQNVFTPHRLDLLRFDFWFLKRNQTPVLKRQIPLSNYEIGNGA